MFHCLLLGEEPLTARCGDHLLERGHVIAAVVARARGLRQWAQARAIPVLEPNAYSSWLARQDIDLLLSITHPHLIAEQDVRRARVAALNYHDGPLPRYAGMNGSAWALASGEKRHAIVWHHLASELDRGDIVEQRELELDARETSHSLNMQNSALALSSFQTLLAKLESGSYAGRPHAIAPTRSWTRRCCSSAPKCRSVGQRRQ